MGNEDAIELLGAANKHIAAKEWVAAFDDLLAAWRALRAIEIAELCDELSARAAKGKKIAGKSQIDRVTTWTKMFHERSALGLSVLLADLDEAWREDAQPRFIVPRLDALGTVHDDPRITTAVIRSLPKIGYGASWRKALLRCARALEAAHDPRSIQELEAALKKKSLKQHFPDQSWGSRTIESLRKKKLHENPPALPNEARAVVMSIRAAIAAIPESEVIDSPAREKPKSGADPAVLLEQVRASPDDDELRLVLADALDAAGDPLGELIVLQIRRANGESTTKTIARERALLKTHMKTFLGAIAPVVKLKSAVFERGFLERCEAVARRQVDAQIHFQHAEWATVRSIYFESEARITPAMRSLREALNVDEHALMQLAESGHPKLEHLGLAYNAFRGEATDAFVACSADKLPALRHLDLNAYMTDTSRIDSFLAAPWAKNLRTFGVTCRNPLTPFLELLRTQDQLEEVRIDSLLGYRASFHKGTADDASRPTFKLRIEESVIGYGLDQLGRDFQELATAKLGEVIVESAIGIEANLARRIREGVALLKNVSKVTAPFPLIVETVGSSSSSA